MFLNPYVFGVTLTTPHRGLGLLMIYDYHLPDATLKLVINLKTKYYRLLFSNASRSICLSIESMFSLHHGDKISPSD